MQRSALTVLTCFNMVALQEPKSAPRETIRSKTTSPGSWTFQHGCHGFQAMAAMGCMLFAARPARMQARLRSRRSRRTLSRSTEDLDKGQEDERFQRTRLVTFTGMVLGYAVYYFTRLSFTYVGLAMRSDLGLSMVQFGHNQFSVPPGIHELQVSLWRLVRPVGLSSLDLFPGTHVHWSSKHCLFNSEHSAHLHVDLAFEWSFPGLWCHSLQQDAGELVPSSKSWKVVE